MEKYNLLFCILDEHSALLDTSKDEFNKLKSHYALDGATLVLVFLGKSATRIIAGHNLNEIEHIPAFEDLKSSGDISLSIQTWIYEAQANMYTGDRTRTAVIVDASDAIVLDNKIDPITILGGFEDTDYFRASERNGEVIYEQAAVSYIEMLEALAKTGDEKAQYKLGLAYLRGSAVEKDLHKAQSLLYQAFLRGNKESLYAMVDFFDSPQKFVCEAAAQHGHLKAQWLTGKQYFNYYTQGEGTTLDLEKAKHWLGKATEQGHEEASGLLKEVMLLLNA